MSYSQQMLRKYEMTDETPSVLWFRHSIYVEQLNQHLLSMPGQLYGGPDTFHVKTFLVSFLTSSSLGSQVKTSPGSLRWSESLPHTHRTPQTSLCHIGLGNCCLWFVGSFSLCPHQTVSLWRVRAVSVFLPIVSSADS